MDVCNELPGYTDSLHHLVAIDESTKSHFNNFNKWLLDIKSFRYTITFLFITFWKVSNCFSNRDLHKVPLKSSVLHHTQPAQK